MGPCFNARTPVSGTAWCPGQWVVSVLRQRFLQPKTGGWQWPWKAPTSDVWLPAAWSVYPSVLERNIFYLCFEVNKVDGEGAWVGEMWNFSILIFKRVSGLKSAHSPSLCSKCFHITMSFPSHSSSAQEAGIVLAVSFPFYK